MKPSRLLLILLPLAIAACSLTPSPSPTLIPVPSAQASPTDSSTPGLLVRLDVGDDVRGIGRHAIDYRADGLVVRASNGAMETNTLTANGLDALRALLAKDEDLLSRAASITPQFSPGKSSSGRATALYTFVLARPNGARYAVVVPSSASPDAPSWLPDPAIERLNALAAALLDPASFAGSGGLANPSWAAWRPDKMAVFITFSEVDPAFASDGLAPDFASIGWPFASAPDSFGSAFTGPNGDQRCAFLPAGDVLAALNKFSAVGGRLAAGQIAAGSTWRSSTLLWSAKGPTTAISLAVLALLPEDGAVSCADALSY